MSRLSYKSKFALCVAGAFIGIWLSATGLVALDSGDTLLNLSPILDSVGHFGVAANFGVAIVAGVLSLLTLGGSILGRIIQALFPDARDW